MGERHLGVALDFSPSSNYALQWTLENVARDGDSLFLIVVNKKNTMEESKRALWGASGSPLIPFEEFKDANVVKSYGLTVHPEVNSILDAAMTRKKVKVMAKVYYGDAREKLIHAIDEFPIHAMFMGCRGLTTVQRVILGSVTNHIVNNAACAVTVIKLNEGAS